MKGRTVLTVKKRALLYFTVEKENKKLTLSGLHVSTPTSYFDDFWLA
jgi:hypothetical protein